MQSILVTGANKGIGYAVAEAILREQPQYRVLLGCRDPQRGQAASKQLLEETGAEPERIQAVPLDVSDDKSVAQAAAQLLGAAEELYALVNNAGIASGSLQRMLAINSYGVRRVSEQLMRLITDGGRVVNVTSASGPNYVARCDAKWQRFFQDEQLEWAQLDRFMQNCLQMDVEELASIGLPPDADYGLSKACANLYSMICARTNPRLKIHACTPGFIETDLTREMTGASGKGAADLGMKQPEDGARVIMHLLFEPVQGSGHYYGSDARRSPLDRYRSPGSAAYNGD